MTPAPLFVFPFRLFEQGDIIVAVRFAWGPHYLHILVGVLTALLCLTMLCVAVEAPTPIVSRIETSKVGEQLFTFRGRYMVDLLVALFLFAMGAWGIFAAILTLLLIFGIRFVGVKQPEAFNEIFRQTDLEAQGDTYTLEGTYDTTGSEGR